MADSIVDLFVEPGTIAELTVWRTGTTNADSVVTLTVDPEITDLEAVASTDSSGDDQGRVDITVPADAPAGSYTWSAEIDGEVVWTGQIFIEQNARNTNYAAHSPDIHSLTDPPFIIYRPDDLSPPDTSGVPAGGTTGQVLTKTSDDDGDADWETPAAGAGLPAGGTTGQVLVKGSDDDFDADWADVAGIGDVTAASTFGTTNRAIVSDGTGKGVKSSTVTINGAAVSGITTLAMTGALSGATSISATAATFTDLTATGTITGISAGDVGADASGTASSAVAAHVAAPDPHTQYQLESAKGVAGGYASLNGDGHVVEPALSLTDGTDTFTIGSLTDTQFLYLDGTTIKSKVASGAGDVVGPSGATVDSVPVLDATGKVLAESPVTIDSSTGDMAGVGDLAISGALTGATAITTTDLTATGTITGIAASDVGADASGTAAAAVAAHIAAGDPHTQYQKESEKGAAGGYASLDGDQFVVEPALNVTDGTSTFTFGALTDTQVLYLDGTTIKSKVAAGGGDVTGPSGAVADSVATLDATGKVIQETPVTIDSSTGDVAGVGDLTMAGDLSGAASISATAATFTNLTATGTITGISAADVGADATGTASAAVATHVGLSDPHTQYQLESEKGSANGYAGLDASGYMTAPSTKARVTGATLDWAGVTDGQMVVRSGTNLTSQAIPATVAAHTVGNAVPTGGTNGDVYERVTTGDYWTRTAGVWARNNLVSSMPNMSGFCFEAIPRNNSGTLTHTGGQLSSTLFGSATGVTYATTNARTSHIRVAFNGGTTANTVCSGILTPQQGIVHVGSTSRHGRFHMLYRFGFASVVQANFRFFGGIITTGGTFSDDPTGAGSVLGDRIGLAVDANTSLAAKWIVNYSGANQNNTAAHTLVQDNWYELVIYTTPLSNVIHMELWEQTTANGALTLVSSIDFAVTSDIVDMAMRPYLAAANAGTAAASTNMHFGGLFGRCLFTR